MTTDNKCSGLKELDPVQGLVDYINDVKPYHTKVIEILVEYVYQERLDVIITDEMMTDIHIFQPEETPVAHGCSQNGYSTLPFGSPGVPDMARLLEIEDYYQTEFGMDIELVGTYLGGYPILPPNPSISDFNYSSYPAFDLVNNSITIPGNRQGDFPPGTSVQIVGRIESTCDSITSIADCATSDCAVADDNSGCTSGGGSGQTDYFFGGCGANGYTFTVAQSVYEPGTIPTNDGQYLVGDDPHTVITFVEPMPPSIVPSIAIEDTYVAAVRLCPLEIIGVLAYSNAIRRYNSLTSEYSQTPDEGYYNREIVGVTVSTIDFNTGFAIPDTGKFVVPGNVDTSNVFVGDALRVYGATGNNGLFTIRSFSYDAINDETTIGVDENVRSDIIDGTARLDIPSNVFIVVGNHTQRFRQGYQFNVNGGSYDGTYVVLSSDYYEGFTRIRVAESLIDVDDGTEIISISGSDVFIRNNQTPRYPTGTQINIVGSEFNDGEFEVVSSSYDSVTDTTSITLDNTLTTETAGRITISRFGFIKEDTLGYGEIPPLCETTAETMVRVYFDEGIIFDGMGVDLRDDVLVYNMENTGLPGGFVVPLNTIIGNTPPCVVRNAFPPSSPSPNDLWFDSNRRIFHRWDERRNQWEPEQTVYWLEGEAPGGNLADFGPGILHYRTVTHNVDTGWVIMLAHPPGYNSSQPAVAKMQQIHQEILSTSGTLPDSPPTLFTISQPVPNSDPTLIEVDVAGVPAAITLVSATEFTIDSDYFNDQQVIVRLFDRNNYRVTDETCNDGGSTIQGVPYEWQYETNANISPYNGLTPHEVYHTDVRVDGDRYEISGGDFVPRMVEKIPFTVYRESQTTHEQTVRLLAIHSVDPVTNKLFLEGDFSTLFPVGANIAVKTSIGLTERFTVAGTAYDGTNTAITVNQRLIGHPTRVAQYHFGSEEYVVHDIDDVTDSIIIPGNYVDRFTPDTMVKLQMATQQSTDVLWRVTSRTYDTVNGRTIIAVVAHSTDDDPEYNQSNNLDNFSANATAVAVTDAELEYFVVAGDLIAQTGPLEVNHRILITGTDNDDGTYTIQSTEYIPSLNETRVVVYQDIPTVKDQLAFGAPGTATVVIPSQAILQPAVLEEYLYTPTAYYLWANGDEHTYVVPRTPVYPDVTSLTYIWIGPVRFDVGIDRRDLASSAINEKLTASDHLFTQVGRYQILDTDHVANTFRINGTDPVTGYPINLTDSFRPGVPFNVFGSVGDGVDVSNDENYVVVSAVWDGTPPVNGVWSGTGDTIITVADISFDETNATNWVHGNILKPEAAEENAAQATIVDELDFGWGTKHRWPIVNTDASNDIIFLAGDITNALDPDDINADVSINGSLWNDGDYEIVSYVYNITNDETEITITPSLPADQRADPINDLLPEPRGYFELEDVDITDWFQYNIRTADAVNNTFMVVGDATADVMNGMEIRVFGTTNDGIHVVVGAPVFDSVTGLTTIQVVSISNNENGGWIESRRDYGIRIILEDSIGVQVEESADAFLILDSGSVIGSFDYKYFDVGTFDESVGQIVRLYGNKLP